MGDSWAGVAKLEGYEGGFPLSPCRCLVCVWCAGVRRAETLIGHPVLCKNFLNMKFGGLIHEHVTLLLAVVSLDLKHV